MTFKRAKTLLAAALAALSAATVQAAPQAAPQRDSVSIAPPDVTPGNFGGGGGSGLTPEEAFQKKYAGRTFTCSNNVSQSLYNIYYSGSWLPRSQAMTALAHLDAQGVLSLDSMTVGTGTNPPYTSVNWNNLLAAGAYDIAYGATSGYGDPSLRSIISIANNAVTFNRSVGMNKYARVWGGGGRRNLRSIDVGADIQTQLDRNSWKRYGRVFFSWGAASTGWRVQYSDNSETWTEKTLKAKGSCTTDWLPID